MEIPLERGLLGYDPCYHMQVAMLRYPDMRFWVRAAAGKPVALRRFFRRLLVGLRIANWLVPLLALAGPAGVVARSGCPSAPARPSCRSGRSPSRT
jgi:hypothetical protein